MNWRSRGGAARLLLVPSLAVVAVSAAGCSASACVGSGCDSGKVLFGNNFKQGSKGGSVSVVGQTTSFKLGQNVAMVADLSEDAGAKTLTLKVTGPKHSVSLPYHVTSAKDNEFANLFTPANLDSLGIRTAGSYTFHMLRGTKSLATGTMTEK